VPNGKHPPDFSDLAAPAQEGAVDFSDLAVSPPMLEELRERVFGQLSTFAPEATAALPTRGGVKPLTRVGDDRPFESFDEFLELGRKIQTGEVPVAQREVGIEPITAPLFFQPSIQVAKAFGPRHFVDTVAGLLSLPFTISYNAFKEFATTASPLPLEFREKAKEVIGEFNPEEAEEARRALAAFAASIAVGGAAGSLGAGLISSLGAAAGREVPVGALALARTQIGGIAGAATFGALEVPPADREAQAFAYALMALPVGMMFKVKPQ
jgi:hypothetical protein